MSLIHSSNIYRMLTMCQEFEQRLWKAPFPVETYFPKKIEYEILHKKDMGPEQ